MTTERFVKFPILPPASFDPPLGLTCHATLDRLDGSIKFDADCDDRTIRYPLVFLSERGLASFVDVTHSHPEDKP